MSEVHLAGVSDLMVGHLPEGERLTIDVSIRRAEAGSPYRTIDHQPVRHYVELAISGFLRDARGRELGGGQNRDDLRAVTAPADGFTVEGLAKVADIWERWHLNGMNAACAHMPEDAHARWDRGETVECSEGSGYTYGKAWLVEHVPPDVFETLATELGFDLPSFNRQGVLL